MADQLHCHDETVRRVSNACNTHGVAVLTPGSSRPHRTHTHFADASRDRLPQLVRQSPRTFGYATSVWTLELLAEGRDAEGLTTQRVSTETIRQALKRLGIRWRRAKHGITSPDPDYPHKNTSATASSG